MAYATTETKSWIGRLGSSFGGIAIGAACLAGGTALLWWNEGSFVKTRAALDEAQGATVALAGIDAADAANNGRLVHATGLAQAQDTPTDPLFGISVGAIRLERTVEFYQWVEKKETQTRTKLGGGEETTTTYSYAKEWTDEPVDSERFADPAARDERKNHAIFALENLTAQAADVAFGAFRLPKFLIDSIRGAEAFNVEIPSETLRALNARASASVFPPQSERPPQNPPEAPAVQSATNAIGASSAPTQTLAEPSTPAVPPLAHVAGSTVYFGLNPSAPMVGDARAAFKRTPSTIVSIIAKQNGAAFEPYISKNGKTIGMLSMGASSSENMYGAAHSGNSAKAWFLRVLGALIVCFGLGRIVAPLKIAADVVPLLGRLAGAGVGIFCMMAGLAWSLIAAAAAWLFYRPALGVALLLCAAALFALLAKKGRAAKSR